MSTISAWISVTSRNVEYYRLRNLAIVNKRSLEIDDVTIMPFKKLKFH